MADLAITVKANTESAIAQFKELGDVSEILTKRQKALVESYNAQNVDKFINKQKLVKAAVTAVKGETEANAKVMKNYGAEIQRLISNGMTPENEHLKKLQVEYDRLTEKTRLAGEGIKSMEKAALAGAAALAATGAAVGVAVQKTTEAGDQYAKNARAIGTSAEAFQELTFAADRQGVSSETLTNAMRKLNVQMADIKNGAGAATKYLEENNKALLDELKSAKNNEQAFNLMMNAIKESSNEFERAALATEIFGKAGQDLIKMADAGVEGINALREEAREYGIISNEAAAASETYIDAQANLKAALAGVGYELSEALIPAFTGAMQGAADFISGIDNWEGILETAAVAMATATSAVTAFLVVTKGKAVIDAMTTSIKGMTAALAANPIGMVAAGVTTMAVPAFIALAKHMDESANKVRILSKELKENKEKYAESSDALRDLTPEKKLDYETTDKLIKLYPELSGKIEAYKNTVGDARAALEELNRAKNQEKIDEMVRAYQKELSAIDEYRKGITATTYVVENSMGVQREAAQKTLEQQAYMFDQMVKHAEDSRDAIGAAYEGIGQQLLSLGKYGGAMTANIEIKPVITTVNMRGETADAVVNKIEETLSQRLNKITLTPEQNYGLDLKTFESFLKTRADMENATGAERVAAIAEQENLILAALTLSEEQKQALLQASARLRNDILKEEADTKAKTQLKDYEDFVKNNEDKLAVVQRYMGLENDAEARDFEQRMADLTANYELEQAMLAEQMAKLKEMTNVDNEWKLQEEERINLAMLESRKKLGEGTKEIEEDERKQRMMTLEVASQVAGGLSSIISAAGKENKAAAMAAKAIDIVQTHINTAKAISNALAQPSPPPLVAAQAFALGAAGLAQEITIAQSMIPSAETGGRFEIPPSFTGVDNAFIRLNQGEVADITPRSETGGLGRPLHITVNINRQPVIDIVQDALDSRELNITAGYNV